MKFLTTLQVKSIPGTVKWRLLADLIFEAADGEIYRAPRGTATDFFSIPGPLRGFTFRSRKYPEAAVMHDSAYRGTLQRKTTDGWQTALVTKDYSDKHLLVDPAKVLGAPRSLQRVLYLGVKFGGKRSFKGAITWPS